MFNDCKLPRAVLRLHVRQVFLSLTVGLNVCVLLSGQSAAPAGGISSPLSPTPAGQTPVVHVDTRLVVIDVVVSDKQGRRVTGLKKEDSAVKENGKDKTIKAFWAHMPLAQQKAGRYELRLGIMDDATGKLGTVGLSFQVPGSIPAAK